MQNANTYRATEKTNFDSFGFDGTGNETLITLKYIAFF